MPIAEAPEIRWRFETTARQHSTAKAAFARGSFHPHCLDLLFAAMWVLRAMADTAVRDELGLSCAVDGVECIAIKRVLRRVLEKNLPCWRCLDE